MQSSAKVTVITSQNFLTQNASSILASVPQDTERLYVPSHSTESSQVVAQAIDSKKFQAILAETPVTLSYYNVLKLAHREKTVGTTQVYVSNPLRTGPHAQELKNKVTQAVSEGRQIRSIHIESLRAKKQSSAADISDAIANLLNADVEDVDLLVRLSGQSLRATRQTSTVNVSDAIASHLSAGTQDIDLLLHLSGQNVRTIQAIGDTVYASQPTSMNTLVASHPQTGIIHKQSPSDKNEKEVTIAPISSKTTFTSSVSVSGKLASGALFSIHLNDSENTEDITHVSVCLSNGEVLTATLKLTNGQNQNETLSNLSGQVIDQYAGLEEAARVVRVYECADESLRTHRIVTLKHLEDGLTPVRTVGTAGFLDTGLFIPCSLNRSVGVTGLYSAKEEPLREIFSKVTRNGEPLAFSASNEDNFKQSYSEKPFFYIPSIPGKRKDQEMVDGLKAGYIVLAEKPAFANADLGKAFLQTISEDEKKRLYFGWHYQHHYVFRKVLEDVNKKTFGKIKHIRTHFTVPMIWKKNFRIFEPSQGGAGIDIYCYNLHFTLRLLGFNHTFEVVQSEIESAKDWDTSNPDLPLIDITLKNKLAFGNGATADFYASFNSDTIMHSEGEIFFEDGTKILCKEFVHPQIMTGSPFKPTIIWKAGATRWEDYLTDRDTNNPEYLLTTYDQQVEFIRQQASGEGNYDLNNDVDGLGVEANIKLHEIIDAVFIKGGFKLKPGA